MPQSSATIVAWRFVVVALALAGAAQLAIDLFFSPLVLGPERAGARVFFASIYAQRGPTQFLVKAMPPDSPLASQGVVEGDRLAFDDPMGVWYGRLAGERVPLTVIHGTQDRRIEVTVPALGALPAYQVVEYVTDAALKLACLVVGVLIGWRRPDLTAYRGLAVAILLLGNGWPYAAPAAAHIAWLDFLSSSAFSILAAAGVFFAINYPDDRPAGLRASAKRAYPWVFAALAALTIFYFARLYEGFYERYVASLLNGAVVALLALFLVGILLAYREQRGESRERLTWIVATLGTLAAAGLVGLLDTLFGHPIPAPILGPVLNVVALLAMAGLVYAILRRRIFDFGLAVNRTLVFAIVGGILLGIFQAANGVATRLLHFDDHNKALLLSAILAATVYLSFNQLKKHVEKLVDRVFFHAWTVDEDALKRFVEEASHATDANALEALLVSAVDRFTHDAGCSVYMHAGDRFVRGRGTTSTGPAAFDVNDPTVLAMLARRKAVRAQGTADLDGAALALPMMQRANLLGILLVAPLRNGDAYRDDQVNALESAAHKVGIDFHALSVERLERELESARRVAETLRAQLDTALQARAAEARQKAQS